MATLEWHVTRDEGVTLVRLLVTCERPERIRVVNCLDGPVWPPRRQGVPEEGWDDETFERVVTDGRVVVGYATPAPPEEPPARIVRTEPVGDDDRPVSARDIIRTLGDPRPPRDAITPTGEEPTARNRQADRQTTTPVTGGESTAEGWNAEDADQEPANEDRGECGQQAVPEGMTRSSRDTPAVTPDEQGVTVAAWIEGVRERVETAERLARVQSVSDATEAISEVGGPDDIAALQEQLREDRERLDRLAREGETLASRIETIEVPVDALQRLA